METSQTGCQTLLVLTNLPDAPSAEALAKALVSARLAACVNVLAPCHSVYRWQGEIVTNREVVCVIKSTAARYSELVERLTELHPYDVPEIVRLSVESVNQAYLDWVVAECDPGAASGRTDGDGQLDEI